MKAITLHGPGDVRMESVADARVVDRTDVVVRVTTSAVCGSDLHQRIITHTLPPGDAPQGYAIFDMKEDRAIKVMLKP